MVGSVCCPPTCLFVVPGPGVLLGRRVHANHLPPPLLLQTDVEGGSYELYAIPKDAAGREVSRKWRFGC